ncbi:MAG: helix-turn-helix domain-containing protein, partial [Polyangiaceae bacterium]
MARSGIGPALGTRIRAQREAMGWSQAKLAEVVDLTPNYVGALERGEALPTVLTLV